MKKTYNVYSFFEKTRVSTGLRSIAMMFVFIVCFLGYSSGVSAQTFNTNPNTGATNGVNATIDASLVKGQVFAQSENDAVLSLRQELENLKLETPTNGVISETTYGAKLHFLENATTSLGSGNEIPTALLSAYQSTANFVNDTYAVSVDVEGIVRTYVALLK